MSTGNIQQFQPGFMKKTAIVGDLFHRPKNLDEESGYFSAALLLACFAFPANAAPAASAPVSDGSMLQVMLGLGLVLAVIAGCAWLLRRFGGLPRGPANIIKVIGGSPVGQRERVVLVEVADTWLVIGVAPGHVTALHSMPKGERPATIASEHAHRADRAGGGRFSDWLRQVMERRNEK